MAVWAERRRVLDRIFSTQRKRDAMMNFAVERAIPCPCERGRLMACLACALRPLKNLDDHIGTAYECARLHIDPSWKSFLALQPRVPRGCTQLT